jgi:hypothetical protein
MLRRSRAASRGDPRAALPVPALRPSSASPAASSLEPGAGLGSSRHTLALHAQEKLVQARTVDPPEFVAGGERLGFPLLQGDPRQPAELIDPHAEEVGGQQRLGVGERTFAGDYPPVPTSAEAESLRHLLDAEPGPHAQVFKDIADGYLGEYVTVVLHVRVGLGKINTVMVLIAQATP